MDDYLARIMGRGGARKGDLLWKGDADEGVRQLCIELGWEKDLDQLIEDGRAALEKKWRSMEKAAGPTHSEDDAEEVKPPPTDTLGRDLLPRSELSAAAKVEAAGQPRAASNGVVASEESRNDDVDTGVEQLQKAIEKDLKLADSP